MKILHTADIHLREYGDDRWQTLQDLIEVGKQEKIDIFVISGDLFNGGIDAEILRPKIREILSNTGFKIILLPGNHDSESYASGMYFGSDVSILTNLNEPVQHEDLMIWGLPFEPIEGERIISKLRYLASNLPTDKKNILLYHGELLDTFFSRRDFGDEGEARYMPAKLSYFKELNIDYVLAGHFHSRFEIWHLENGGYFVYPGSPISITRKETGLRKINIFEVGSPPREYRLDTPHFEEVVIEFDPFLEKNPIEVVKEHFAKLHPRARIILTITGYINSEKTKVGETQLFRQLEEMIGARCNEYDFKAEFRDVHIILEDDLFKNFVNKLEQCNYDEEKKKQLCDLAIRAMMEARA